MTSETDQEVLASFGVVFAWVHSVVPSQIHARREVPQLAAMWRVLGTYEVDKCSTGFAVRRTDTRCWALLPPVRVFIHLVNVESEWPTGR